MSASDYELALRMQEELNRELSNTEVRGRREVSSPEIVKSPEQHSRKRPYSEFDLDGTQQIVHPLWETLDPTPDIFGMFKGFDTKFFQGKLHCVELEWSKRMYSCAGICYQRKNRYGMACTIRLSEPLLKLRSRKNLVETLLHEMIHAYLFILNVREGNGGHGANFCRIMTNINKAAGTNITVYHTFIDEVNFYKTHIWRCNGICQHRGPFFGYVRRTSNRAPGANDQWWAHHQEQCGGTFLKVSQPDPVAKKPRGKAGTVTAGKNNSKIDDPRWGMVRKAIPKASTASKVSTITVPKSVKSSKDSVPPTNPLTADLSAGRSLSNVVGFRDLNGDNPAASSSTARILSSTNGRTLGTSGSANQSKTSSSTPDHRANVRDIWSKKFPTSSSPKQTSKSDTLAEGEPICLHSPPKSNWVMIDDDIEIENVVHETVTILDDSISIHDISTDNPVRQSSNEGTIRREIMDSFDDDLTDSDIELIDHDYDDSEGAPTGGLCDKTITDNLFSWNKSTEDLNKIHMTDEENAGNRDRELVSCPVCNIKCERDLMSDHLDGCFGMVRKIDPRRAVKPPIRGKKSPKSTNARTSTVTTSTFIPTAATEDEEEFNRRILSEMEAEARESRSNGGAVARDEWTECPVCTNSVKAAEINDHLDMCLA
ncbi:hypothetical protein HA402_015736 [Bradysia odoriphaga]|nr:hypothetical protein HA402_015736 [Bradysia odoriphaga]